MNCNKWLRTSIFQNKSLKLFILVTPKNEKPPSPHSVNPHLFPIVLIFHDGTIGRIYLTCWQSASMPTFFIGDILPVFGNKVYVLIHWLEKNLKLFFSHTFHRKDFSPSLTHFRNERFKPIQIFFKNLAETSLHH